MPKTYTPFTVRLPSDLYESLRLRAFESRTSMAQVVCDAVRKELETKPINCRTCGKEFYLTESLEYLQGFCSDSCQAEYHGHSVPAHR